jgi:hypothetical protein
MEWKRPPLHRHLSTIGIGPVFICPPPHSLPPHPVEESRISVDEGTSTLEHDIVDTWETIGDIKSSPEDFLVREIGWAPLLALSEDVNKYDISIGKYGRLPGWTRQIAGLEHQSHSETTSGETLLLEENKEGCSNNATVSTKKRRICVSNNEQELLKQEPAFAVDSKQHVSGKNETDNPMSKPYSTLYGDEKPLDGLQRILTICHSAYDANVPESKQPLQQDVATADILQKLADLQSLAIKLIASSQPTATKQSSMAAASDAEGNIVWIPTANITQKTADTEINDNENWKLLHRYIRLEYSLLRTEASSVGPEIVGESLDRSWICVSIDKTFFPIAPLLARPSEDLVALYTFRNIGPVDVANENERGKQKRGYFSQHNRRNKRNNMRIEHNQLDGTEESVTGTAGQVSLRLRHDLPREERRVIHQALTSSRRRDFDTSTKHDVSLNTDPNSPKTTAIVVQWSRNAVLGSQKKRGRSGQVTSSDISAIFCVLRKHQCEHQVAINSIAHALKCKIGDIGLAGIKDMQAVTYQFCTLRNVDLNKLHRAKESLGIRVQLSNFVQVKGSESLLDRGRLLGSEYIHSLIAFLSLLVNVLFILL